MVGSQGIHVMGSAYQVYEESFYGSETNVQVPYQCCYRDVRLLGERENGRLNVMVSSVIFAVF